MAVDYVHWWPALDYTKINVDEENVVFNKSGGTRQKESNRWPKNKSATCRSINVRRGSHDRSIIIGRGSKTRPLWHFLDGWRPKSGRRRLIG